MLGLCWWLGKWVNAANLAEGLERSSFSHGRISTGKHRAVGGHRLATEFIVFAQ
jgi:hypothetical protein